MIAGIIGIGLVLVVSGFLLRPRSMQPPYTESSRTNEQWRELLTPEQYFITREGGTERAGSNDEYTYMFQKQSGTFYDVTGEQPLFHTRDQFDSKTGWPSFTKPISDDALLKRTDYRIGIPRTEILSSTYGHHLGHVFKDGPAPTGLRYCMNAAALQFVPDEG